MQKLYYSCWFHLGKYFENLCNFLKFFSYSWHELALILYIYIIELILYMYMYFFSDLYFTET